MRKVGGASTDFIYGCTSFKIVIVRLHIYTKLPFGHHSSLRYHEKIIGSMGSLASESLLLSSVVAALPPSSEIQKLMPFS